jgi:hypothetical protein
MRLCLDETLVILAKSTPNTMGLHIMNTVHFWQQMLIFYLLPFCFILMLNYKYRCPEGTAGPISSASCRANHKEQVTWKM